MVSGAVGLITACVPPSLRRMAVSVWLTATVVIPVTESFAASVIVTSKPYVPASLKAATVFFAALAPLAEKDTLPPTGSFQATTYRRGLLHRRRRPRNRDRGGPAAHRHVAVDGDRLDDGRPLNHRRSRQRRTEHHSRFRAVRCAASDLRPAAFFPGRECGLQRDCAAMALLLQCSVRREKRRRVLVRWKDHADKRISLLAPRVLR